MRYFFLIFFSLLLHAEYFRAYCSTSVVIERSTDSIGITTLRLKNGIKVFLKPTNFKNNEVLLSAISHGGLWNYHDKRDIHCAKFIEIIGNLSDYGSYTRVKIDSLAKRSAISLKFRVNDISTEIDGKSKSTNIDTLLSLNRALFSQTRISMQRYESAINVYRDKLLSYNNIPINQFSDSILAVVYNHDEHYSELNFKSGAQNYIRCNKLITDRLKFPSSFTFSLVGDFTVDSIIPYIIKYLASIPVSTIKGNTSESSYLPTANGTHRSDFLVASDGIPKSYQFKLLSGNLPYSLKNEIYLDFIEPIMKSVFFMQLRECGIENVNINSSASLSKFENKWSYSYTFSCADSLCSVIDSLAITAFKKLLQDGIDSATFNKVKSLVLMQYRYSLHDNSYWITMLRNRSLGIEKINGTAAILDNISVLDFNRFLKSLDYGGNVIDVTMKCGKRKGRGSL